MSKLNGILQTNKVSQIEFHITEMELEDFIIRSADLIKDGYHLLSVMRDTNLNVCPNLGEPYEPYLHIIFARNKWE